MTKPRIYVACLASYNNGKLHGAWIDAAQDAEQLHAEIADMLSKSPTPGAEEWAIHDSEGFFALSENPNLETVSLHARMVEEHDGAWLAYCGNVGQEYADEDGFSDTYRGQYSSAEDFAQEIIEETHDLKSMGALANYIDYESFARDMSYDGWAFIADGSGGVYVFSS